jgi:serine/threonine protein kinase
MSAFTRGGDESENAHAEARSLQESNRSAPSLLSLVELLRELHLLDPAQLAELDGDLRQRSPDPRELARELVRRGWLTGYQVNQLVRGKGDELVLGPYVLLDRLGAGGMGHVFKARHRTLDRLCALKTIRKEHVASPDAVRRFLREARAAARLAHPNIVTLFDADQVGGTHFLAMEYVEGIDLDRLVAERGPLPLARACAYLREAALGLQHAHEQGLVHRDVKPHNLLLKADGTQVKVVDLGLALMAAGPRVSTVTQAGACMGTPAYMAPEQCLDAHAADARSDVYSLGCTLFFLLTGRPPFGGAMPIQALAGHLQGEIPSLAASVPGAPPELDALLRRLLAKKPEQRLQRAGEVAEELLRFIPGKTGGGPAPPLPPVGPLAARRPAQVPEAQATARELPTQQLGSAAAQRRLQLTAAPHRQTSRRAGPIALLLTLLALIGTVAGAYLGWSYRGSVNRPADLPLANGDEPAPVAVVGPPKAEAPPQPEIAPKPEPRPRPKPPLPPQPPPEPAPKREPAPGADPGRQPPPNALIPRFGVQIRIGNNFMMNGLGGVGPEVIGSRKLASVTRQAASFSAITLHAGLSRVTVVPGEQEEVTIKAEDNLLRLLASEVAGSTLSLGFADGSRVQVNQPIEIEVRFKVLKRLQLKSGATVEARDVRAESLEVVLSNHGTVTMTGQADELKLSLLNHGTFRGGGLATKRATLELQNHGYAVVKVSDLLDISLRNKGVVEYLGAPQVRKSGKVGGQVRKITAPR